MKDTLYALSSETVISKFCTLNESPLMGTVFSCSITQPPTEASKYQKTNSYNIPCNGNSELAIEAANVFADKYGGSSYDWNLTSVDASVSGMEGTYRYTYSWAGNTYTATRKFKITDYGTYRNYSWEGDIANLFYGS